MFHRHCWLVSLSLMEQKAVDMILDSYQADTLYLLI